MSKTGARDEMDYWRHQFRPSVLRSNRNSSDREGLYVPFPICKPSPSAVFARRYLALSFCDVGCAAARLWGRYGLGKRRRRQTRRRKSWEWMPCFSFTRKKLTAPLHARSAASRTPRLFTLTAPLHSSEAAFAQSCDGSESSLSREAELSGVFVRAH
eukprot:1951284-Rhodomonas_salina.1